MRTFCYFVLVVFIGNIFNLVQTAIPDTLLVPFNSEVKANCACGKINDLERAKKGEFPWLVSLVSKNDIGNEPLCWGSLINNKYVVSAAHCTSKYSPVEVEILLGSSSHQQNPRREVASIKNHPGFIIGNSTYDNDISLVKLRTPVDLELGDITHICLPPLTPPFHATNESKHNFTKWSQDCDFASDPEEKTATMSKFKGFVTADYQKSYQFDKISLHILKNQSCSVLYPKRIKAQFLCAEFLGDSGANKSTKASGRCHADNGGPLIYLRKMKNSCDSDYNSTVSANTKETMKVRFIQVGVASTQSECQPNTTRPAVLFTKISRYISWIKDNTRDGTYCSNSPTSTTYPK